MVPIQAVSVKRTIAVAINNGLEITGLSIIIDRNEMVIIKQNRNVKNSRISLNTDLCIFYCALIIRVNHDSNVRQ